MKDALFPVSAEVLKFPLTRTPRRFTEFLQHDSKLSAIIVGDASKTLARLPDNTVQTCITSPPYWSLRDYGIPGQIGLERSFRGYLQHLVTAFSQVRRVLRDDGTLWLVIGDSYTSGGRTWRAPDKKNPGRAMSVRPPTPDGMKPKDLIGIPWRLVFALQEAGWYLRSEIIWHKPNCQPESVKDRPTRSHEYIFLLSKSEQYYYDPSVVRGPNDRNLRTVWDINTQGVRDAHFAVFPPALVSPCVRLTSRPGDLVLDPFLGSGTTALVALELGRRVLGIELNPDYADIAERRLNGAIIRTNSQSAPSPGDTPSRVSPTPGGRAKDVARGCADGNRGAVAAGNGQERTARSRAARGSARARAGVGS